MLTIAAVLLTGQVRFHQGYDSHARMTTRLNVESVDATLGKRNFEVQMVGAGSGFVFNGLMLCRRAGATSMRCFDRRELSGGVIPLFNILDLNVLDTFTPYKSDARLVCDKPDTRNLVCRVQ